MHNWLVRHFFFPLLKIGAPKKVAAMSVFVFSAAMHEYLVSAPNGIFRLWAYVFSFAIVALSVT